MIVVTGLILFLFVQCTLLLQQHETEVPAPPPFCDSVREPWSGYSNCFEGESDDPVWGLVRIRLEWEYADIGIEDFCNLLSGTCELVAEDGRQRLFLVFGEVVEEGGSHYASLRALEGELRASDELIQITVRLMEDGDSPRVEFGSDGTAGFPRGPYVLTQCITM